MTEQEFGEQKARGKGNIFIGTLNVAMRPAQAITGQVKKTFRTKYAGKYRRARLLFYVDIILLGIIAALLLVVGFLYFYKPSVADKIRVDIKILPDEVVSGRDVSFIWTYKNESEVILDELYWSFNLPNNFEVISTLPPREDPTKNVIKLGVLPPQAEGRVKMQGRVWGAVGDPQTIWSSMGFVQAENQKIEQKAISTSYVVADSVLDVKLTAPERVVNNQEVELKFNYKNTGEEKLDQAKIHVYWPSGFEYSSGDIALQDGVWNLGALEPGDEGELKFRGFLASPENMARFYFETYAQVWGENIRQEVLASVSEILPPQLEIITKVNDSTEPVLGWGDQANVAIEYTNISDYTLEDLTFALDVDPYFINTARLTGLVFKDGKFYFSDKVENLRPGESKTVSTNIYLKTSPDWSSFAEAKNITVSLGSEAKYKIQGEEQEVVFKSRKAIAKMETPFYATIFSRYWTKEGDQLGRGPIPPRVGRSTKYWVFWNLGDTTNKLTNIYLQMKLPANVSYAGLSSVAVGDKINYDPDSRMITWYLKELDPTMISGMTVGVSLEVEIIPAPSQAGSSAALIEWVKMSAMDEFTGQEVSYTSGAVTTDLTYDTKAAGLGTVR